MEIVVAVLGPMMGGLISLVVFVNKKNSEFMSNEFNRIHESLSSVTEKVDELRINVAENYVTNDELTAHITGEEAWHIRFGEEMAQTRDECTATRVIVDRMWMDYQNQGKL
tara:strand:+ start:375 stop:707 length:333 start_codon:yes stop_codon:yes gene_type:complete